ncbi:ABC transporter permease [Brevibacterium sp. 5221]|uniref:ABC transporter permease n=1 Tax=Brevibacterium rongguiense TaxID=2695267 RepID=A0A6N9H9Y6_9MICO|nr:YhgE/Pip domain-containing protein [Brevibacterium rongguiense]MYM20867.1 ABC transporter permease [Brevibacterium rongguiense]
MALFERADSGRRVTWLSILGLVLVPVIIAAGFVFATWKADDRLSQVKAAVVNDDDGAKINGKQAPLGRQLAAGLVDSEDQDENYDWVLSDDEDATAGLKSGEYVAVVHIPKDFSKAVATTAGDDPMKAAQATIDVTSSKVSPISDAAISQAIATTARTTFNTEYTKQYLDGIYVGFNKMGDQFGEMADAAGKLDDGAKGLKEGTSGLSTGVGQLDSGVGELDKSGGQISGGAAQLASGADGLATGLTKLDKGTKQLPSQTRKLADGAGNLSDGVDQYTKGTDQMVKQLSSMGSEDSGLGKLADGADQVATGTRGVSDGIVKYRKGLEQGAEEAGDALTSGKIPSLDQAVKSGLLTKKQAAQIKAQFCPTGTQDQVCEGILKAYIAGVLSGTAGSLEGAAKGLQAEDPKSGQSLESSADKVAAVAERYAGGVHKAVSQLQEGTKQIADKQDELLAGSKQLRSGAGQLADGTDKLADGMKPLAAGVTQASDGAQQYATGAHKYAAGVGAYTGGVHKLASGTGQLAQGAEKLDQGTGKYEEGVGKFADGLDKGKDDVPSYTKTERDRMSEAVSSPIADNIDGLKGISQASSIALLLIMALWIGALITYTVVRAVSATALTSRRRSIAIMGKGLIPGIVISLMQAVILTGLSQLILTLDAGDLVKVFGLSAFAGIVFTVINYALVAWFGGVGRFVSVILVVAAVTAKVLTAVPGWLSGLAAFMPLTPAMDGITGIATGTGGAGAAFGTLLLWLLVAGGAAVAAVARKRTMGPAGLTRLAGV